MRVQVEVTSALQDYIAEMSLREPAALAALREETEQMPGAIMQVSPEEGQFLGVLVRALGASRVLEVGTFTGYSTISIARALPAGGSVLSCDISSEASSIALAHARRAGVEDKVDLRVGDAVGVLTGLAGRADRRGSFDLVFIDADKEGYADYYEIALRLVRPGGLILVDNVLWHGAVLDEAEQDSETTAIRAFNEKIREDERVDLSILPFADGLAFAVKR
ncbi:MAG: class I SAM-dependent methyltransferase [Saccharopolyspora sp.]|uniref:O-methyltransferase n=1 Tax=unclassified Saccharopolyspora TaxID=2646250 RepID=UPI0025F38B69|nr:class I SAM-dependent methyltransferase [Saccharopolyspora sp.]MBQ6642030.1 class I SAM-dependent methyltransferase [Saccharopolyspora sp.]